jgi:hypothetical protein
MEDAVRRYLTMGSLQGDRNQTRNVREVDRPLKVFADPLVLTLTLHQADDPLLFWRERIAKLAKGLVGCIG